MNLRISVQTIMVAIGILLASGAAYADDKKDTKSLRERLERLENKASNSVVFVSQGSVSVFGIEAPTAPPTEEELEELEEFYNLN